MGIDSSGEQNLGIEKSVRSKEVVRNEMERTRSNFEEAIDKGNNFYNNLSRETQDEIDNVVLDIFDDQELSLSERSKKIDEVLLEYKDNPEVIEAINSYSNIKGMEIELTRLEEEYKPFKLEEIRGYADQLSKKIDFDTVADYFLNRENHPMSDDLLLEDFFLLREVNLGGNLDHLDEVEDRLKSLSKSCEEKEFLRGDDQSDIENEELNGLTRLKLLEETGAIVDELYTYTYRLFGTYRVGDSFGDNLDKFTDLLEYGVRGGGKKEINESVFDPRFLKSIGKKFREKVIELKGDGWLSQNSEEVKKYIEAKRGNWKDIFETLEMEGFIEEEGEKIVVTEDSIKSFLEGSFPTAFLKKIQKIEASKERPVADVDLNDTGKKLKIETLGSYKSGHILMYEPISVKKDSWIGEMVPKKFKRTLTHEIGHGVLENLSIDEMKGWEEVMEKDDAEITWYVGYSKGKSEKMKKREDFCESFMAFVHDPGVLRILSESRFEYMRNLFEKYMDLDKLSKFKENLWVTLELADMIFEVSGYTTKERLKNYYLHTYGRN